MEKMCVAYYPNMNRAELRNKIWLKHYDPSYYRGVSHSVWIIPGTINPLED